MDSSLEVKDVSRSNLVIITNKNRVMRFFKIYRKTIIFLMTCVFLSPITVIGNNNAYLSFYVFLVCAVLWTGNICHPAVISLLPVAFFTITGAFDRKLINAILIRNSVMDCFGVMMVIVAIEHSLLHKRIAIRILLIFGCSHYKLSFLLYFCTMALSMWFTNCMACGLMMPLVKAILSELEKMGIMETNEITIVKHNSDIKGHTPTDFTIFYFLGVAYSSSIGGMATLIGSETNLIFKNYCELIFPGSPKLEGPHVVLFTLPGVLIMETFLYLWLNFYFLGMLRVRNYTALQTTLTADEEQYINILLRTQYQQLGKIKFHELAVGALVIITACLQAIISTNNLNDHKQLDNYNVIKSSTPTIISALILFIIPVDLNCFRFFRNNDDDSEPLPSSPSQGCLTWTLVNNNIQWSVLFVIASSALIFEAMKEAKMSVEFEKLLMLFSETSAPMLAFVVIVFCKVMTEFGSNASVMCCLLPHVARLSVAAKVNPLYLMLSTALSTSLPFLLITGTPAYAMVSTYVNIPPRKMMIAGIGPSITSILTNLFTVCVWSKAIWPDIGTYPVWADTKYIKDL